MLNLCYDFEVVIAMPWHKQNYLVTMGKSLALELFWLKAELIRMYSNDTNRCSRCGAHGLKGKPLQLHHLQHDGDVDRSRWEMGSTTPHVMGYYYQMYFDYMHNPDEAVKRIAVLCGRCNRLDHIAREAVREGNKKMQALVVDNIR